MLQVKEQHSWKGTIYVLMNRIRKIVKASSFTARDIRLLKRLLKEENQNSISMEEVHSHFPGKTMEQILEFRREYLNI